MEKEEQKIDEKNEVQDLNCREDKAAQILGLSVKTLQLWRHKKKGPAYVKLGGAVRYPYRDLVAYNESKKIHPAA